MVFGPWLYMGAEILFCKKPLFRHFGEMSLEKSKIVTGFSGPILLAFSFTQNAHDPIKHQNPPQTIAIKISNSMGTVLELRLMYF